MSTHTKTREKTDISEKVKSPWQLILENDNVNTFDHVIECLMKYCDHSEEQALQCAMIVHNNGKCSVKLGSYEKLRPIWETLLEKGLSAKIEEN